jgi:hypothetical protein
MYDPDVVLRVDRDAGNRPEHPMVGQRFRPEGIDFEGWGLDPAASLGRRRPNGRGVDDPEGDEKYNEYPADIEAGPPPRIAHLCLAFEFKAATVTAILLFFEFPYS